MHKRLHLCVFLVILFTLAVGNETGATGAGLAAELRSKIPALAESRQLIVVTAGDWNAVGARLQRFERADAAASWAALGPATEVVVGRNGMAWGIGLHGTHPAAEPIKREGDGRAPAGVFRLNEIFGYATATEAKIVAFPYKELTPSTEGVDDVRSKYYNRVVDSALISDKDWKSSEIMLRPDNLYQWGVVVENNWKPSPGAGSCIFLHVWRGPRQGTAGCTAMPKDKMEGIVRWLDRQKKPLLVQLPAQTYARMKHHWNLPAVD
jgi:D-alanyl-D-alanine dipeptidase